MRLNKHISESGICSRREADAWIAAGRVTVNGAPGALGTQVKPGDDVRVDGKLLPERRQAIYIALNKPSGVTCTTERDVPGIDRLNRQLDADERRQLIGIGEEESAQRLHHRAHLV